MMYMTRSITGIDGDLEIELAILKDAQHIAKYEAQGFVSCSYEVFREAWRARDTRTFERLRAPRWARVRTRPRPEASTTFQSEVALSRCR
jgi:hypothetical protein